MHAMGMMRDSNAYHGLTFRSSEAAEEEDVVLRQRYAPSAATHDAPDAGQQYGCATITPQHWPLEEERRGRAATMSGEARERERER